MNNKFEKFKGGGLCGLQNLGNTCFMNSCIQMLSHTYEFNLFLDNNIYKSKLNICVESTLIVEWDNLRKCLWRNNNTVISPEPFLNKIHRISELKGNDNFSGFLQNDMSEFLLFVIDCFHTSLSRNVNMRVKGKCLDTMDTTAIKCYGMMKKMYSNDYSEILKIFYAIHVSQILSIETGEILNVTPEPFFIIHLPLPQNTNSTTLEACFDNYVKGEILDGENSWFNEKTKKKEGVVKKLCFWCFPEILVIDIKRFNNRNVKNKCLVTFPLNELNLSKYVIGYNSESYVYELYGVCNHSGNVNGGHYTCHIKNSNGKWYHFNDATVSEVKTETAIISSKAYCFFYRKKTINNIYNGNK